MSTKQSVTVVAPAAHKLTPTITSKAKAVATADGRKRPIVAINEDGKLVVCCRRTAKKNGWDIQEVLYERAKATKTEAPAAPVVVVKAPSKTKVQATAKKVAVALHDVEDLLK